ncbi:aromatic prenyltransferase [Streptomyces sp. NBC_01808]|uniref:aromatic prenyltransferase n=1 Tax=Streptomyces sp. NBC_01808 TaxID=2975947 RepID=UPI002DDC3396|nr:aromatic prenyltransferase [Streptomyces sp. NBC_01808]WSA38400.1 aromatic prenyltransferase [Streptomyces sp. NBC_01808]
MSANPGIERLCAAAGEAAGLVGVDCPPEKMTALLTAFPNVVTDSTVVFNAVNKGGSIRDISFDFTVPLAEGNPYERALEHGLAEETDHPVRGMFADLLTTLPVDCYGVDYGVNSGFNKSYAVFPMGQLQELGRLAAVPAMSTALSKWMDVLVEYGLDSKVSTVAIDHANRTWNVYFNGLSPEHFERATVQAMLRDFGLPEPSGQLLDFAATSSALYPTFGWDAAEIERVSFSTRTTDPAALPSHIEPKLGVLAAKAPYTYEGDRKLVFAGALTADGEYYKLATYYQLATAAHDRVRRGS